MLGNELLGPVRPVLLAMDFFPPDMVADIEQVMLNTLIIEDAAKYGTVEELAARRDQEVALLNDRQRDVYTAVMDAVSQDQTDDLPDSHPTILVANDPRSRLAKAFFVDGPGGGGKTFTENLILTAVRALGLPAVAMASSGIASLLLHGGTTAHSRLKIPIDITTDSILNIRAQSPEAEFLRQARLFIWDEAPMMHKHCFEAFDRAMRELMGNVPGQQWRRELPFGGKVVVMSGDFRQVLPVVPRGSRAAIVGASLRRSKLWRDIKVRGEWEGERGKSLRPHIFLKRLKP